MMQILAREMLVHAGLVKLAIFAPQDFLTLFVLPLNANVPTVTNYFRRLFGHFYNVFAHSPITFLYSKGRYQPQGGMQPIAPLCLNPNCTGATLTTLAMTGGKERPSVTRVRAYSKAARSDSTLTTRTAGSRGLRTVLRSRRYQTRCRFDPIPSPCAP